MPVTAKKLGEVRTTLAVVFAAPTAASVGSAGAQVAVETISGTTRTVAARESPSQRLPPAANCISVAGSAKGSGRKVVVVITLTTVATPTKTRVRSATTIDAYRRRRPLTWLAC